MTSFIFGGDGQETPEDAARRKRQAVARALAQSSQAQSVGDAIGQGMSGFGDALAYRQQQPQNQFPDAPGGGAPSFMQAIKNMMGFRSGGLF
ncbi:hypothetical protein [Aliirhizobium smilacinae]|uniref:Uncharacterized protein n=1 Tax=Aliirhizobium smilacinae TaxID=1395944 RepID=A0A5C4XSB0_9HYPH|nr:hypothetical protein [Rhizobium smilacinae]TNM66476.1 hypothetical protein FHP24_09840 [Rhizobium smilacinae]